MPAASARRPLGASYAVTMAIFSPRRLISRSSGSGSLPAVHDAYAGLRLRRSCEFSFQEDVVDEADRADADGGREHGAPSRSSSST